MPFEIDEMDVPMTEGMVIPGEGVVSPLVTKEGKVPVTEGG